MAINKKNLDVKQSLLTEMLKESLTRSEFEEIAVKLANHVKNIEAKTNSDFERISNALSSASENVKNTTASDFKSLKEETAKLVKQNLSSLKETLEGKIIDMEFKVANLRNGKDADEKKIVGKVLEKIVIPKIEEIENNLPKLGEQIRNSLELLEGDERIDISAIKGLKKYMEKTGKKGVLDTSEIGGLRPAETGVEAVSGVLNGVNKAFTVSLVPKFITVNGQSMYDGCGYTLSSVSGVLTVTLDNAPESTEIIRSHY